MVTMFSSIFWLFAFHIFIFQTTAEFNNMRISPSGSRHARKPSSPSERITIRLRTPPKNTRRIDVTPPGKDSRIIRVKPATRYPVTDPSATMPTLSAEELYNFLSEMGLNKISSLLRKADLGQNIINKGPITIFAPTDEAFSLMPHETLEVSNDPKKLEEFLLNHMTKGHIRPQEVRNDVTMASLQSSLLRFNIYNQGQVITVSGAKFLDFGKTASWTMIQPIDRVLNPVSRINLVNRLRVSYPRMHSYVVSSGLSEQLASGTFTLFAPADEAFRNLPEKAQEIILSNSTLLRKVILNHIVPGAFFSTVFTNGFELRSLGADPLTFTTSRGLILVNGIPILKPDVEVTNGVIHKLNRVLIPPEVIEMCRCMPMYLTAPATVQPWPTFPVTHSEDSPYGTRIKPPFHRPASHVKVPTKVLTDVQHPVVKKPVTTEPSPAIPSRKQPAVVAFSTRKQVQVPISQILTDPMDLPDGTQATFTTANHLFKKALLINRLKNSGPYTLLLPTDEAFTRLSQNTMGRLEGNGKLLRRVLLCHVIDTRIPPESLKNNGRLQTLGGPLVVSVQNGTQLMIGGGNILTIQPATNGIIYVTNRVTYPIPQPAVDHVLHDPNLANDVSIWSKIISNSGMQTVLKGPNVYTMFVPSNAAFSRFPQHVLEQLYQNKNLLNDLVSSHVVQGAYFRTMITEGLVLSSLNGNKLRFGIISDGFVVNEAPVLRPGVITGNGVVYVISTLLYEPTPYRSLEPQQSDGIESSGLMAPTTGKDLMEIGRLNNATAFLRWMEPTGFLDVIQAGGRYTLFLPSNTAIGSMSPTLRFALSGDTRQRRRVIQYHISPISMANVDITNELLLQTLLPTRPVRCNVYHMGRVVTINGGPIVKMIPKDNLTVVIVNRTLTPPAGDLFLTVSKSPMLRNFTKIIKVAKMEDELKSGGPYTLFAPSKCAFSRLSPEEYEQLIADPQAAREFVKRHLVKGSVYTIGVKDGMRFMTEYPSPLRIKVLPTCITVNNVKIKYGDVSATNGVLHIVAEVL